MIVHDQLIEEVDGMINLMDQWVDGWVSHPTGAVRRLADVRATVVIGTTARPVVGRQTADERTEPS